MTTRKAALTLAAVATAALVLTTTSTNSIAAEAVWNGGPGDWADENWDDGIAPPPVGPGADMLMTIDAATGDSRVTVAADFVSGGIGPAAALAVGETNSATLIVNDAVTLEVTGDVAVGDSGSLIVDGRLTAANLASSGALRGNGTISAATVAQGIVAPGRSAGVLSFQSALQLGENAVYQCEIAEWDSTGVREPWNPIPAAGAVNDQIRTVGDDLLLGGTLSLKARSRLHPMLEVSVDPPAMVHWYGDQTRVIVSASGDNRVVNTFDSVPDAQPESLGTNFPGAPEFGQGHIGRGVFLTRQNRGGQNDEPGVSYSDNAVKVHLFQAIAGDTNGDRDLNGRDIGNLQACFSYGFPGTGPGPNGEWDWTEGDFNADTIVDALDISAILATGLWPTNGYSAVEPGEPGGGIVDLIIDPTDNSLTLDTGDVTINGYVIRSAEGIFTGGPAENLGWFVEDTDRSISGNMGFELNGRHRLGAVIGPEWEIIGKPPVDPYQDLTFTYTIVGTPGTYYGNQIIVPEPSTLLLAAVAGLGLMAAAVRRRRSPGV